MHIYRFDMQSDFDDIPIQGCQEEHQAEGFCCRLFFEYQQEYWFPSSPRSDRFRFCPFCAASLPSVREDIKIGKPQALGFL